MDENEFYDTIDKMEAVDPDFTNGYYPTIDELEAYKVQNDLDFFLPLVAYFASDPLRKTNAEEAENVEYKATVKYCKDMLTKVELF